MQFFLTILDKRLLKIHEIKPNRFFYRMIFADYLQFFAEKHQNIAYGWQTGYSPSNRRILGIFKIS